MGLKNVPLATDLKVVLVVMAASLILVASYDLLVRATWIGALLNGRRDSRRIFTLGQLVAGHVERYEHSATPEAAGWPIAPSPPTRSRARVGGA
jgi:hypothetical protein